MVFRHNRLLQSGVFVLVFLLFDWISFVHPYGHLPLTPWNPHTGVALAWLCRVGTRFWPLVMAAHAFAILNVGGALVDMPAVVVAASLIYGGVYGGTAGILRRFGADRRWKAEPEHFGRFMMLAAAASFAVSTMMISLFVVSGQLTTAEMAHAFLRGWIGDLIGILLFTPLLLRLEGAVQAISLPSPERVIQLVTIMVACWIVFGLEITDEFKFFYLLFPPMLWMSVRGGTVPCLWGMGMMQVCLILAATIRDLSDEKTTALQFLMLALVATGLLVSGQVEIRQRAEAALRDRLGELARLGRIHSTAEIATGLVHELKQPMLAILNYVGAAIRLLERCPPAIDDALGIIRKADMQVERADAILRRMRSYVQKGAPHISSVVVGDAFREAVDLVTPLSRRHAVRVTVCPTAGLPLLLADPIQVLQVLVNLLSNAIHVIAEHNCPEREVVLVARRVSPNRVEIAVSDSGPGLADEVVGELYQPFVTTRSDGMGLGLAISRSIVEAHGGTLIHDAPCPGHGATFRLTLPCAEVDDAD